MKHRKFPLLIVLGLLLIVLSLTAVLFLQICTHIGAEHCREATAKMEELLPERSIGVPDATLDPQMPVLDLDGEDYVALLEIPALNVSLPVADVWDRTKLYDTPARFFGSTYDSTLILGGMDSSHQFSFCDKIDLGTLVLVTDMTGTQFSYTVTRVDRSSNIRNQWLMKTDSDLTLFCYDLYSMKYIAVRCKHSAH